MDIPCKFCKALHFQAEKVSGKAHSFNDCCSYGEVALAELPDALLILREFFENTHALSRAIFDNIRFYNSSFLFASFNANLVTFNNRRSGPFCFKIQGQIYYQINTSLCPADDELPSFGQLFIVDQEAAANYRCQNTSLNAVIATAIDAVMRKHNIFAHSYEMKQDELESMTEAHDGIEPELQLLFTLKPGMDRGCYNFQRTNEVAVFSTTSNGEIPESYVTIRNKNDQKLDFVSSMDPNVEPWIYPLFYSYGTQGWHANLRCVHKDKRISRSAYIQYRMAIRQDEFNFFVRGRRLFQQWVVDNYAKVERDRINFCRSHQKQLRAESYQGLIDHLQKMANENNTDVGKVVILPSTFIGSPRCMLQLYQDSMAIVRKYGKPDLFITMTCNPKWTEITENLLPGQTAADRPDLVSRVFDIKKDELIKDLKDKKVFGDVLSWVYVVKYQKRGLPHVHILLTLNQNSKIKSPDMVDKYISAEIPDPNPNNELHNIVMTNMIRGPYGNWCLNENKKCSKKFPKNFTDETTMDENGYPKYRRRNTGVAYVKNGNFEVNNRNVVPYSPFLLQKFYLQK